MITLGEFVEMAIDNVYDCYIWDCEKEENVFEGTLREIPEDLLEADFSSWEIEGNRIGLNINQYRKRHSNSFKVRVNNEGEQAKAEGKRLGKNMISSRGIEAVC